MNKVRVIDLLNKIANGEEVPKKIKYKNEIREYVYVDRDYINKNSNNFYLFYNIMKAGKGSDFANALNDEVEIIEDTPKEDKKIEKLDLEELNDLLRADLSYDNLFHKTHKMLVQTKSKINEIIDKINGE